MPDHRYVSRYTHMCICLSVILSSVYKLIMVDCHIRKFESKTEQAANAHKLTTPTTFAIMSECLSINSRSRSVTKRSSEIADLGVSKRQQRKTCPNKLWDIEVLEEEDYRVKFTTVDTALSTTGG